MTSKPPHDDTYFPEDERSSMDWEDDHSADSRSSGLTTANPTSPGVPSPLDRDRCLSDSSKTSPPAGYVPQGSAPTPPEAPVPVQESPTPPLPADGYFPEDERSSMDWEDDHSADSRSTGLALTPSPGRDMPLPPGGVARAKDGEGSDAEMKGLLHKPLQPAPPVGYVPPAPKPSAPAAATAQPGSVEEKEEDVSPPPFPWKEASEEDLNALHPSLAASLAASISYAEEQRAAAVEEAETPLAQEEANADPMAQKNGDAPLPSGLEAAEDAELPLSGPASAEATSPSVTELPERDAETTATNNESFPEGGNALAAIVADVAVTDNGSESDDSEEDEEEEDEDEAEEKDRPMTLRDHLTELRKRVGRSFLCIVLGFALCYPFSEKLFDYLLIPLLTVLPASSNLIYTALPEAFFTYMKVAFVAGIFVASPLIFYQVWAFIAPGLYKEEKMYIVPVAFFSAFFFITGGAFCFFIAFPFAFEFFMSYNVGRIQAMPSLHEYLSFVLQLLLAFGLIFELPLFVFFLARLGIVTAAWMRKMRRYAVLANVIVAAVLTPPDVMSQMLMAAPLLLLYEISIFVALIFGRKKPEQEPEGDGESDAVEKTAQSGEETPPPPEKEA